MIYRRKNVRICFLFLQINLFFFPRFFVPSSQHLLVWGSDNTKYQEWRCVNPFVVAWLQCGDQQKKEMPAPRGVFTGY